MNKETLQGQWKQLKGHVRKQFLPKLKVEALVPDELYPLRVGTTDSEAAFLADRAVGNEVIVLACQIKRVDLVEWHEGVDANRLFVFGPPNIAEGQLFPAKVWRVSTSSGRHAKAARRSPSR
jgi:hypothetical protein